ncbi:MAG: LiaF domain-containing protein [Bacillota bacterium]
MRVISFRLVMGLFLLFLGVSIILNRFTGLSINLSTVWSYWPVIPLLLGLNWAVLAFRSSSTEEGRRVFFSWGQFASGLIIAAFGAAFLGRKIWPGYFDFDLNIIWPVLGSLLLIMLGINLLRGRSITGSGGKSAFMGGINVGGRVPWKLESGSYLAFMGGIDIDLTTAEISPGETVLDLTAIMGGIEVKVPKNLAIIYEGSCILGGTTFKGQEDGGIIAGRKIEENLAGAERVIRLQARAVMGGIDIKER